jgi:hypothetical protein
MTERERTEPPPAQHYLIAYRHRGSSELDVVHAEAEATPRLFASLAEAQTWLRDHTPTELAGSDEVVILPVAGKLTERPAP